MTYQRSSRHGTCLCVLLLIMCTITTGQETPSHEAEMYIVRATSRPRILRWKGACFLVSANIRPDKFFKGIRKVETETGVEFRKRSSRITHFPDTIFVEIELTVTTCDAEQLIFVPLASLFWETLHFESQWKTNSHVLPATLLSVTNKPLPSMGMNEVRWTYILGIESKEIPLNHQLIVTILKEDNTEFAQLTFRF